MSLSSGIQEVSPLINTLLMEQSSSWLFFGRTVMRLPTDDKNRKRLEMLGIKWIESLSEKPFLAKALLPEGWTTQRAFTLGPDLNCITIIDNRGQERVKISIKARALDIKYDFKPVCYPNYCRPFYCSYLEIISAIESWGKVEAILMASGGLNHIFIVSFNKPIDLWRSGEGVVKLTCDHGISHTPFSLRGMYRDGSSCSNAILSNSMMAFDIRGLQTGFFSASDLWRSQKLLPDQALTQINEDAGKYPDWKEIRARIDSTFSESDKAKKLLEWIKRSGLSILEKGLNISEDDRIGQYSIDEIVANYTTLESAYPWNVLT